MGIEQIQSRSFTLSSGEECNIELLCHIARLNGDVLSTGDILKIASVEATEEELEDAWHRSNTLGKRFKVSSGLVIGADDPRLDHDGRSNLHEDRHTRFSTAEMNIYFARLFGSWLRNDENLKLLSISGSNSYLSASPEDDLDFFCVTKRDVLWIFLAKSLILRRIFHLRERNSPSTCFSYVIDERYAAEQFSVPRGGLFARDAMMAIVLQGEHFYQKILRKSKWIGAYFPKLYALRVARFPDTNNLSSDSPRAPIFLRVMNELLFFTVGNYITLRSNLLRRRYAKRKIRERTFRVKIGKDHCIFESAEYEELGKIYANFVERSKQGIERPFT